MLPNSASERCVSEKRLRGAPAPVRRSAGCGRIWRRCAIQQGFSVIESLLAVALLAMTAAMAAPPLLGGLDGARGMAAARYVASLVRLTRVQAVMRSTTAGLRFEQTGDAFAYAVFVDGNGNGLRSQDVRHGIDRSITPVERIGDRFPRARIAIAEDVVPIAGSDVSADPVRLGVSDTLTFTPLGTSSGGTIYVQSERGRQYAVRVLGATGRTRVLEFLAETCTWRSR